MRGGGDEASVEAHVEDLLEQAYWASSKQDEVNTSHRIGLITNGVAVLWVCYFVYICIKTV